MINRIITFGEVMLRLKSPGFERLLQSPILEATFGGGEANVAVSLAQFGRQVAFISALPVNPIADACLTLLRGKGVDVNDILRQGERMGTYYYEAGANQRPSYVVYDRKHSSIMDASPDAYDWTRLLEGARWFHITGITPALSANVAQVALQAVETAHRRGLTVSCDYNYRKNLWKYGKSASEVMCELVQYVDIGIANEEDCQYALGITLESGRWETELEAGQLNLERYRELCERVLESFPNLKIQAITLRSSHSADHNGWAACLHNRKDFIVSKRYDVTDIVDRVGTGDSFAAGLIYALSEGMPDIDALEFATAASCLKHSIPGDMNFCTVEEVKALVEGAVSGRIRR
ncbi:MAG: sugar kinase [Chloroflexi bacterium]|nr:sugar kinase [Chloroflexota bacterium]